MPHRLARPKRLQPYVFVTLSFMLAAQILAYWGTRALLPFLPSHVLTGPIDARIPLSVPWVSVYCLSFPFWIVSALWILSDGKPLAYRVGAAYVLAMALSAAVFLLWPGTMARPEVRGSGVFAWMLRLVYRLDSPTNLCPSLHVLISYFCARGALAARRIPRWYKAFSLIFCLLVCCSVLFVKQHTFIDVPAGLLMGELCLQIARIGRLERVGIALEGHFRKE